MGAPVEDHWPTKYRCKNLQDHLDQLASSFDLNEGSKLTLDICRVDVPSHF